MGISWGNN